MVLFLGKQTEKGRVYMENLYAYYTCDEWKSTNSMHLVGIFTETKLREVVLEDYKNNDIELDGYEPEDLKEMKEEGEDVEMINEMGVDAFNDTFIYLYVSSIEINERQ